MRIPYSNREMTINGNIWSNDRMSPIFLATIEATEEAIINSVFAAEDMAGRDRNGHGPSY